MKPSDFAAPASGTGPTSAGTQAGQEARAGIGKWLDSVADRFKQQDAGIQRNAQNVNDAVDTFVSGSPGSTQAAPPSAPTAPATNAAATGNLSSSTPGATMPTPTTPTTTAGQALVRPGATTNSTGGPVSDAAIALDKPTAAQMALGEGAGTTTPAGSSTKPATSQGVAGSDPGTAPTGADAAFGGGKPFTLQGIAGASDPSAYYPGKITAGFDAPATNSVSGSGAPAAGDAKPTAQTSFDPAAATVAGGGKPAPAAAPDDSQAQAAGAQMAAAGNAQAEWLKRQAAAGYANSPKWAAAP